MIVAVAPVIASCIRFAALVEKVLWKALATNPKMLKKIENDPHEKDARTPRAALLLLCLNFWLQTKSNSRQNIRYIDQSNATKSNHIRNRTGLVEYQDYYLH